MLRPTIILTLFLSACSTGNADEIKVHKSICYTNSSGDSDQTSLDIYEPVTGINKPVMIWIHGGAWRIGDKARVEKKPEVFNKHGFLFVSLNYRLHPETNYAGQGADIAQAIRWVHDHAEEYGGSSQKMFLMGHSAGAHLAALVATDQRYLQAEQLELKDLQGVILLDGAGYDIPRQIKIAFFPSMKKMYRTVFTEDLAQQKAASPIQYVTEDKGIPPFLILHVASRKDSRLQSEALGQLLEEAGGSAKVVAAENKTHGTLNREIGLPDDIPTKEILDFLDSRLAK